MTYMTHRCSHNAKKIITDLPYIMDPIMVEILSWLPASDLVRYKVVCKLWKYWIDDRYFIDLHKSRAPRGIIGTVVNDRDRLSLHSDGGDILILNRISLRLVGASTCGLVCIETVGNKYCIFNPATGKRLHLPPLISNSRAVGMRVFPNPQTKKLDVVAFCIYTPTKPDRSFYWAMLTVGVDSEWKIEDFHIRFHDDGPMIWWLALLCESAPSCLGKYLIPDKVMQTFIINPHSQEGKMWTTPFYLDDKSSSILVHEWDGKFAVSSILKEDISTWVLEDDEMNKWRCERVRVPWRKDMLISFVQDGKMWFRTKSRIMELFSLDLFTEKVERITCNEKEIYEFMPYTSTLETLEGMQ